MGARIRELEEALRHARADKSDDLHPLLSDSAPSQRNLEEPLPDTAPAGVPSPSEPETDSFIDALGILN